MTHIGLFEGIGGFSLAARMAGWRTLVTCEIEPFCQRVLRYHFPDAYHHGDIKTLTNETINAELSNRYGTDWRREPVILTGGFPCQPFSTAGKRKGKEDDRHLWPEMLRVIQELQPEWVVGENVYGIVSWNGGLVFEEVQADLEAQGYEVWPVILPASGVGAPHKRDRVWFIAHTTGNRRQRGGQGSEIEDWESESRISRFLERGPEGLCSLGVASHTNRHGYGRNYRSFETGSEERKGEGGKEERQWIRSEFGGAKSEGIATNANSIIRCERGLYQEGSEETKRHLSALDSWDSGRTWENFPTQPPVCGRNDGFPGELDGITLPSWRNNTIKAFGNAIVPQIAYQLFQVINEIEKPTNPFLR